MNDFLPYLQHHGILGMKWGVRRYQNKDGSYTNAGKKRRDGYIRTHRRNLLLGGREKTDDGSKLYSAVTTFGKRKGLSVDKSYAQGFGSSRKEARINSYVDQLSSSSGRSYISDRTRNKFDKKIKKYYSKNISAISNGNLLSSGKKYINRLMSNTK